MQIVNDCTEPAKSTEDYCWQIAALHVASLPESLVSQLGKNYARHFYRYMARSDAEYLLLEVDGKQVRGACVVTTAAGSLKRRLLLRTPVIPWYFLKVARTCAVRLGRGLGRHLSEEVSDSSNMSLNLSPEVPELILLFTSPNFRGTGVGSLLLARCERLLQQLQFHEYWLKTIDEPDNAALGFYKKRGFNNCGALCKDGKRFRIFVKSIAN